MHLNTSVVAFIVASLICFPLYRYFFSAARGNSDEYDEAFKKEFGEDPIDSLLSSEGEGKDNAQKQLLVVAFMMLIPVIISGTLALGIYFLLVYLGLPELIGHF